MINKVQSGSISIPYGSFTVNISIAGVSSVAKCEVYFPQINYFDTSNGINTFELGGMLTSTTNLMLTGYTDLTGKIVQWQVIEYI